MNSMEGEPPVDCTPLLFKIVEHIPAPKDADPEGEFKMLVSNIDWDDYVGRVAIGRITSGTVKKGDTVWLHQSDGSCISGKVTRMFEYSGLSTTDSAIGVAGNIVGVAGFENVNIGETLGGSADTEPLPFVAIDPPTISMEFSINNGPFGGRDGKNVTSRVIRDRLMREMRTNISIQVEDTDKAGVFSVSARGAMQIAVLVETKRFFQISDAVFTFYCPGFCPPKGCAKERYFQKSRYTSSSSSSWMGVVSSGGAPNSTVAKASANTLSAPA